MRSVQKNARLDSGAGNEDSPIKRFLAAVSQSSEISERNKFELSEDLLKYITNDRSAGRHNDLDVFNIYLTSINIPKTLSFTRGVLVPLIEEIIALDGYEMANSYPTATSGHLRLYVGVNGTASISFVSSNSISRDGGVALVVAVKGFTRGYGILEASDDNVDKKGRIKTILGVVTEESALKRAEELLSILGIPTDKASDAINAITKAFNVEAQTEISARVLPSHPPQYAYRSRMPGGIVRYLEDNWAEWIENGLLSRPDLKRIDPSAETALKNFLRTGGKLPPHVYVPTKSETIDRALAAHGFDEASGREATKLASAAKRRAQKTRTPEP